MIELSFRNQKWLIEEPHLTLGEALERIGLGPEVVLALRDGQVLVTADLLEQGDVVRLMPLIAGG